MPLRDPDVELVAAEVRNITLQSVGVMVHGFAEEDPSHVRPELAVARGVRIARAIGMLMMDAVRRHPADRSTFKREARAGGEEIFEPFRALVAAMSQQAMVAHTDA